MALAELMRQAEEFDDDLAKSQEENKEGSALNQAIFKVAEVKGLQQLTAPAVAKAGKGKQKGKRRY